MDIENILPGLKMFVSGLKPTFWGREASLWRRRLIWTLFTSVFYVSKDDAYKDATNQRQSKIKQRSKTKFNCFF